MRFLAQLVFSSTKCVTAFAVATLVDRGLLSYDTKVSSVWPEFSAGHEEDAGGAGKPKSDLTVADVLRHEAGLADLSEENRLPSVQSMWTAGVRENRVGEALQRERCRWPPPSYGTAREYHSFTRGFILNEIFRRVDPQVRP